MTHVVQHPNPPLRSPGGHLDIHQIPAATDNLVWLAVHRTTGEAFVVDGPAAQPVLDYCATHGIQWTTLVNTHVHHDHIGINRDLQDLGRMTDMRVIGAAQTAPQIPGLTEPVKEGDDVTLVGLPTTVWLTEGHINGHLSFIVDGVLFCGDTLFAGGCGYLFDGPPARMHASLQRLAQLPGETLVCCAHEYTQDNLRFAYSVDPDNAELQQRMAQVWAVRAKGGCTLPSTIDLERRTNPFLRVDTPEIGDHLPASEQASTSAERFAALRALKDSKAYRAVPDSALPVPDPVTP